MTVLNLISGLGSSQGAQTPVNTGLSADSSSTLQAADDGSLEAALAFAAALLTESQGNALPADGNILPDTLTPAASEEPLDGGVLPTTPIAGDTVNDEAVLVSSPLIESAEDVLVTTNPVVFRTPANAAGTGNAVLREPSVSPNNTAPAVLAPGVLASLNASLATTGDTAIPDQRIVGVGDTLVPPASSAVSAVDAANNRLSGRQRQPINPALPQPGINNPAPAARDAAASFFDLIPLGDTLRNAPLVQAALANIARASSVRDSLTEALPSGDIRQTTLSGLTSLLPTTSGETGRAALQGQASVVISQPIGSQGWGEQFSQKVGWVIRAGLPSATISLNPDHLGPIEMMVDVEDGLARVQFGALHATTREAIEQSLPRLRDALEQQGVTLEQVDVGGFRGDGRAAAERDLENDHGAPLTADDDVPDQEETLTVTALREPSGLIDTFV
ncbi:MAG: flagellar hook-length control protein FliK [Pseudomonadota bacterium]